MSNEKDEIVPTPEHIEANRQKFLAFLAHSLLDTHLARLATNDRIAHPTEPNCIVVPSLGSKMSVVETDDSVGIGVHKSLKAWLDNWPFDCIAVTAKEVFFVSKPYTWLGTETEAIGVSLGSMFPSELLARMSNQEDCVLYALDDSTPLSGDPLRDGAAIPVHKVQEGVPVLKTRAHAKVSQAKNNPSANDHVNAFYQG